MISSPLLLFAALLVAHAVADFPLQGDFLARAKSGVIGGVPWWWALGMHALINAGGVWLITGVPWLGLMEFVAHTIIDKAKVVADGLGGRHAFTIDQLLHVACKATWVLVLL